MFRPVTERMLSVAPMLVASAMKNSCASVTSKLPSNGQVISTS